MKETLSWSKRASRGGHRRVVTNRKQLTIFIPIRVFLGRVKGNQRRINIDVSHVIARENVPRTKFFTRLDNFHSKENSFPFVEREISF